MKQDKQPVTKAQLEWLQKQKLFANRLWRPWAYESYMRSVIRMIHTFNMNGIGYIHSTIANESLVTRARNNCCISFKTDCPLIFY